MTCPEGASSYTKTLPTLVPVAKDILFSGYAKPALVPVTNDIYFTQLFKKMVAESRMDCVFNNDMIAVVDPDSQRIKKVQRRIIQACTSNIGSPRQRRLHHKEDRTSIENITQSTGPGAVSSALAPIDPLRFFNTYPVLQQTFYSSQTDTNAPTKGDLSWMPVGAAAVRQREKKMNMQARKIQRVMRVKLKSMHSEQAPQDEEKLHDTKKTS